MVGEPACNACGGPMRAKSDWVRACRSCGFMASSLQPGAGTGIEGLETLRRQNFELLLDRLGGLKQLRGARLLEVGSAWGWFLEAAARRGALAHGIEPEVANVEKSRAAGHSVEPGFFPADLKAAGPYDIIVFNDVFEHIPGPEKLGGIIEEHLSPGGLLVINLPSSDGAIFGIATLLDKLGMHGPYERMWQKGFASPHVSYFNAGNLRAMVEGHSRLRWVQGFPLPSVTREGLGDRVRSSHAGLAGLVMLCGIWVLSYALPMLPQDIMVAVFRAPGD